MALQITRTDDELESLYKAESGISHQAALRALYQAGRTDETDAQRDTHHHLKTANGNPQKRPIVNPGLSVGTTTDGGAPTPHTGQENLTAARPVPQRDPAEAIPLNDVTATQDAQYNTQLLNAPERDAAGHNKAPDPTPASEEGDLPTTALVGGTSLEPGPKGTVKDPNAEVRYGDDGPVDPAAASRPIPPGPAKRPPKANTAPGTPSPGQDPPGKHPPSAA